MPRIRIKDIARIAGVSPGTVDRVIHNRGGVSESTRKKIEKIIEEYGYQRDILAGALAANKSYTILLCMPETVDAHAFWKFPEAGVHRAMDELQHFDIDVAYLRFDQHDPADFLHKIEEIDPRDYDGLLFAPVFRENSKEFIRRWREAGVPCVLFNSYLEQVEYNSFIGQDAFQSGYLGGKLMSYGLAPGNDILIINLSLRKDNYEHITEREKGFRAFFEEHSERVNNLVSLNLNGGSYDELALEIDRKMDALNVNGIFVTNSRVHLIARYLSEKGAMYVRLIGYDLLPESVEFLKREYIDFLISQSPEEQAYLGMRSLYNSIILKKEEARKVFLPIDILTKENVDYYLKFNEAYEQPERS